MKYKNFLIVAFAIAWGLGGMGKACGEAQTIFQIGKQDHSYTEFSPERKSGSPVIYQVGTSSPAKDWYAYQPGSLDYQVRYSTRKKSWVDYRPAVKESVPFPFIVKFSIGSLPQGMFILHLDAIFRYEHGATAPRYTVDINGHAGSYQLTPKPAPDLWWPTGGGNLKFIGYQSLDMQMPAEYFHEGNNTLTIRCEDGFGIYYDDLSLNNDKGRGVGRIVSASIAPTMLYKQSGSGLVELAKIRVTTLRPLGAVILRAKIGSRQIETKVDQSGFGDLEATIEVPATDRPVPATLYLQGEKAATYRGSFIPARRWHVYVMPMEQADYGYDETQARTLEWENRYIDKEMEIEKEFPSYSFTLDTSANLESYFQTRDEEHKQQLINYLRNGKFGINALYENFFTGTAATEELFQMLTKSLQAGGQYGFSVDSASQTDEPTVTWALPQVLSAAGIKYFAQGSDPIRGPFNPIGHLNFHSPFYWEAPNGSKVLVWDAVSYIAIEDMTWGGWNLKAVEKHEYSPSLFGMEHSLPLFLSQYNRQDYPFNAVLLYGLHNDEIPIWHYGSADVIKKWNKEYAYPKVIPATQRDFFSYITKNFGPKIATYRGDEGAYWEDEVGADARAEALNRTAQIQVTAAEKLDSIALWMNPFLKFDNAPYQEAWKNIMLGDNYVWSDEDSFSRPYSYLTNYEEEVHRGSTEGAFLQTRDLLRTAMDRMAELVEASKPGFVVFNTEAWQRAGFFDVELEPNEILQSLTTGAPLRCGVLSHQDKYDNVRCWAPETPPLGYQFYSIASGTIPTGEPVNLENTSAWIDSRYYRLQLDSRTGAVAHLIDKATGRDLVNGKTGYGLNEYLYVSGGDPKPSSNRILSADPTLPLPTLTVNREKLVRPPKVKRFPWGIVVTVDAQAMNTPEIRSIITLNDQQKLVTFDNELEKTSTLKKEGVYFAFPFQVERPEVEYHGATAWVNPVKDMLPGANREWFATQGGIRIKGADQSVGWASVDAPLITLEQPNRGLWPSEIEIKNGTVFSYVMNNYWYTDAPPQQGGHFRFRYVLTSGTDFSRADATRFELAARSPLYVLPYEHKEWKRILPEKGMGFVEASPNGVAVLAMRPVPGDTKGHYLLRVQNGVGKAMTAHIRFPVTHLEDAYMGSVLGANTGPVDWSAHEVILPLSPFDVKTLVIRIGLTSK